MARAHSCGRPCRQHGAAAVVREADNPLFRRFRDRTGISVLINTRFNVHEEPIVNRPEECRRALIDGRVDFVVTKKAVYVAASATIPLYPAFGVEAERLDTLTPA